MESLFNKVAAQNACNLIKKRLQHNCFPVKCKKLLRTPILKNICGRLLLYLFSCLICKNITSYSEKLFQNFQETFGKQTLHPAFSSFDFFILNQFLKTKEKSVI